MFSRIPRIGTPTCLNIATPLRASMSATSCGVVTTTAPERAILCVRVSWTSPVPGGDRRGGNPGGPSGTRPRTGPRPSSASGPPQPPAGRRAFEQRRLVRVGVDGRGLVLPEATGVGGGAIGAIEVAPEHARERRLLPAVVRGVRDAAHHDPGPGPPGLEEGNHLFPP